MANEDSVERPLTATVGEQLGKKAHAERAHGLPHELAGEAGRAGEGTGGRRSAGQRGAGKARRASSHRGGWHAAGWWAFFAAVGTWVLLDAVVRRVVRR